MGQLPLTTILSPLLYKGEVGLKFGVSVDVRTGAPYIADGKAGCNLEIMVKCVFPKKAEV